MLGESRVDVGLSHLKGFIGPLLKVAGVELRLVHRVFLGSGLGVIGVRGPVSSAKGQGWVASGLVHHRVPEGVEISHTIDVRGNPLRVATFVTRGVFLVDLSNSVERLVDVAYVVDD